MKRKLFLALMLASGMAFAQSSGSSPGSMDQQQPSTQQPPSSQSNPTSAGQSSSLTGCLKGSDSGWVLIAEGQSTPIKGDSATLGPHNGHQVQVKGTQASDGSFQVTDIVMIADTCTKQQDSSASAGMGAAAGAATGAAAGTATSAADGTQSAASDAASSAQSPTQSTTTPQTPSSTTPPTSTNQSAGATQGAQQKLPQSASPLPLLGLLGLVSLASGLIARRKN